jgi:hypothetical protein
MGPALAFAANANVHHADAERLTVPMVMLLETIHVQSSDRSLSLASRRDVVQQPKKTPCAPL